MHHGQRLFRLSSVSFTLSARSRARLDGVHPDLQRVVYEAIQVTRVDFTVIEGRRTIERQRELVAAGASWTMASRHLTGHAVDIAPMVAGKLRWDWPLFSPMAEAMRTASLRTAIPIRWGGAWRLLAGLPEVITRADLHKTRPDGPHFELPVAQYPA